MANQAKLQTVVKDSPRQLRLIIQMIRCLAKMTGDQNIIHAARQMEQVIQSAITRRQATPDHC